jgi:hypothetical protein
MENNFTRDTSSKLKALAIYQIAGGVIGVGLTVWIILRTPTFSALLLLLLVVILGLYVHSIYCGTLLLDKKTVGLNHSLVNQALQLVSFSILGFTFQYMSGLFLTTGIDLTNSFEILFNAGISSWKIVLRDSEQPLILNFNFIALFLIIFIIRLKNKIQQEQVESQITSIGQ